MSGFKTTQELLEEIPVRCLVIHLGIPAMFGQLFNILYNTADRIFIGKIPETGSLCLASIGICAPALTALTAFAFMIGIGGASYMSISLGQKEERRAREIIGNAFFMILVISAIVTPLLLLNCEKILYLLGSRDMYPYAETYFTIYVCGTFASLLGCGLNQFILAQGFAGQGMISVALGAVVNVVLDPVLIFGCGMGIAGAAWGTVIAQCCTCVYVICYLRNRIITVSLCSGRLQKGIVLRILSIGCMSFMITILDNLIVIFLNTSLRKYGGDSQGYILITCATAFFAGGAYGCMDAALCEEAFLNG